MQTCQRCYKVVIRACQSEAEAASCTTLHATPQRREFMLRAVDSQGCVVYWTGLRGNLLWANENEVTAYRMTFPLARHKALQMNAMLPARWQPWCVVQVSS